MTMNTKDARRGVVEVVDGVVTLRDLAPGRETRLARAIAETVHGVRRVMVSPLPPRVT